MSNTRQSTSILRNSYNSRGMTCHRFAANRNLIIQEDGTLWALIASGANDLELRRSTDNAFSWEVVNDDMFFGSTMRQENLAIHGPINHLTVMPNRDRITAWFANRTATPDYEVAFSTTKLSRDLTDSDNWSENEPSELDDDEVDDGVFCVASNDYRSFIIYIDGSDDLHCAEWHANNVTNIETPASISSETFEAPFDALATVNGKVHCAVTVANSLKYASYAQSSGAWNATVRTIREGVSGATIVEPSIAIDGHGTLMVVWGEENTDSTAIDLYYAISTNDGTTWTATKIDREAGWLAFTDAIKSTFAVRTDNIGGVNGGFLFTYTEKNSSGVNKVLVRELSTTDGSTYTLGTAALAAPVADDVDVAGGRFFKPPGSALLNLENKSLIRMAFQIGEGDSTLQADSIPVHFDTELLQHSAYPLFLDSETSTYTADTSGGSAELVVDVKIIPGPTNNIDFYDAGMVGPKTEAYMAAFDRLATSCRVLQYGPNEDSYLSDKSAYDEPIEHCSCMVWDPISYADPAPNLESTQLDDFVERDVRKVYIRPSFHLSRDFILNEGNFLKRTVWTTFFNGNEYELTQVVPHFMDNQICYYEANAYVVGPSRNPWSRAVLLSET